MATNDFLPFATGGGANVESQGSYAVDSQRGLGQQPGLARSAINNKAIRQATYVAANLAQFICDITGLDMLDDATPANIAAALVAAFRKPPTFTKFLTGSGTYTPPAHCLYLKVRLVGGGGGGYGGTGNGGHAGDTTFGTALLVGSGGNFNVGGGFSLGAAVGFGRTGQTGVGIGGSTPFGAGGLSDALAPGSPAVNSGAGGGGNAGAGGGGGGYVEALITGTLAGSYAYAVGAGGAAGTGGGGTAGAAGAIYIEEFYG